jgi:hypothetical protein
VTRGAADSGAKVDDFAACWNATESNDAFLEDLACPRAWQASSYGLRVRVMPVLPHDVLIAVASAVIELLNLVLV